MSEQTLFTIAHDIAVLKEFPENAKIINQDVKSVYNLNRMKNEADAIKKFSKREPEYIKQQK